MECEFKTFPVHHYKHFLDECSEILNEQWPRSKAARDHSINKSTDALPVSLAFVRNNRDGSYEVLGFSKISAVQGINKAGLVESVVLRKTQRGKGLGRILMNLTEDYGKKVGINTMYLSTHDKEGFYARLGYERCQPVISLGANAHRVPESMLQHFMATTISPSKQSIPAQNGENKESTSKEEATKHENHQISPTLPPPPPPPPPLLNPSPKNTSGELITRLDPNCVVWMKKDLL